MEENLHTTPLRENLTQAFPSIKQSFAILGIILILSVGGMPILIASAFIPKVLTQPIAFMLYYLFVFGGALFMSYIYKQHVEKKKPELSSLKISDTLLIPLTMLCAITLLIGITIPIIELIPIPEFLTHYFQNSRTGSNNIMTVLIVIVVAPLLEEFLFRGIILDGLLKRYSPTKAIWVSSILFGLMHFNPWQFVSAMIVGLLAGWIYYRTKELLLCILIHLANNAWATFSADAFENRTGDSLHATNHFIYVAPALLVAFLCLYLIKARLKTKEDEELPMD